MSRSFNRHDLVWLNLDAVKHAEYAGPLPMEPIAALSLLHRWVLGEYPLIVARQNDVPEGLLRLGLAEPASWGKRRLSFLVKVVDIKQHKQGPLLNAVLPTLPPQWHVGVTALQAFLNEQKIDHCVYGSHAVQALTGLPIVTKNSDLDLLFKPLSWLAAERLCQFLAALQTERPEINIDGEVFNLRGQAVQWRELFLCLHEADAQVLCKTNQAVALVALADYQSGFVCPVGSAA